MLKISFILSLSLITGALLAYVLGNLVMTIIERGKRKLEHLRQGAKVAKIPLTSTRRRANIHQDR